MNKCEWKDGEFEACGVGITQAHGFDCYGKFYVSSFVFRDNPAYCPFCGADIRKPEPPEPLIIESGQTWVVTWKGIDYLCINPAVAKSTYCLSTLFRNLEPNGIPTCMKSFTGPNPDITELTDKIAKLRPMVTHKELPTTSIILYGINENQAIFIPPVHMFASNIRLATAKELQEEKQG